MHAALLLTAMLAIPTLLIAAQTLPAGSIVKSIASGAWSDPEIWEPHPPREGDTVIISDGTAVLYDVETSPKLKHVIVEGKLEFSRELSTALVAGNITIVEQGYMEVGTRMNPIPENVKTMLILAAAREGDASIIVRGQLQIHGAPVKPTFTKLATTAAAGSRELVLAEPVNWKPGSRVVITSTSLNPRETEENVVERVDGNRVLLREPLRYLHEGGGLASGEVALLTRNVLITSLNPDIHAAGIMFMRGAIGGISYAELRDLGARDILGKYPIHFHHVRGSMRGTVIEGVAIWNSNNRFITIHDTDGIIVRNSVGYKAIGHGFFLEDGNEMYNALINNIAILTLPGRIRPDDARASGFWIQNPVNRIINNIAVSSYGAGFDLAIPIRAPEVIPMDIDNLRESSWRTLSPRVLKILAFMGNEAHSNRLDGVRLYRLAKTQADDGMNVFTNLKLWRNGAAGMRITASEAVIEDSLFFGNRGGNLILDGVNVRMDNLTLRGEIATTLVVGKYRVAPFGLMFTGTDIKVSNSFFAGHATKGNVASADIIHLPPRFPLEVYMSITDTTLGSERQIIFGYPLNAKSRIEVRNVNGESYTLYRYDTEYCSTWRLDVPSMALKCPA